MSATVALVVQLFYAWRIQRLSGSRILSGVIVFVRDTPWRNTGQRILTASSAGFRTGWWWDRVRRSGTMRSTSLRPAGMTLGEQMKIYNPSLLDLAHFKGPVIVSVWSPVRRRVTSKLIFPTDVAPGQHSRGLADCGVHDNFGPCLCASQNRTAR